LEIPGGSLALFLELLEILPGFLATADSCFESSSASVFFTWFSFTIWALLADNYVRAVSRAVTRSREYPWQKASSLNHAVPKTILFCEGSFTSSNNPWRLANVQAERSGAYNLN
jgi:hypothetical protein